MFLGYEVKALSSTKQKKNKPIFLIEEYFKQMLCTTLKIQPQSTWTDWSRAEIHFMDSSQSTTAIPSQYQGGSKALYPKEENPAERKDKKAKDPIHTIEVKDPKNKESHSKDALYQSLCQHPFFKDLPEALINFEFNFDNQAAMTAWLLSLQVRSHHLNAFLIQQGYHPARSMNKGEVGYNSVEISVLEKLSDSGLRRHFYIFSPAVVTAEIFKVEENTDLTTVKLAEQRAFIRQGEALFYVIAAKTENGVLRVPIENIGLNLAEFDEAFQLANRRKLLPQELKKISLMTDFVPDLASVEIEKELIQTLFSQPDRKHPHLLAHISFDLNCDESDDSQDKVILSQPVFEQYDTEQTESFFALTNEDPFAIEWMHYFFGLGFLDSKIIFSDSTPVVRYQGLDKGQTIPLYRLEKLKELITHSSIPVSCQELFNALKQSYASLSSIYDIERSFKVFGVIVQKLAELKKQAQTEKEAPLEEDSDDEIIQEPPNAAFLKKISEAQEEIGIFIPEYYFSAAMEDPVSHLNYFKKVDELVSDKALFNRALLRYVSFLPRETAKNVVFDAFNSASLIFEKFIDPQVVIPLEPSLSNERFPAEAVIEILLRCAKEKTEEKYLGAEFNQAIFSLEFNLALLRLSIESKEAYQSVLQYYQTTQYFRLFEALKSKLIQADFTYRGFLGLEKGEYKNALKICDRQKIAFWQSNLAYCLEEEKAQQKLLEAIQSDKDLYKLIRILRSHRKLTRQLMLLIFEKGSEAQKIFLDKLIHKWMSGSIQHSSLVSAALFAVFHKIENKKEEEPIVQQLVDCVRARQKMADNAKTLAEKVAFYTKLQESIEPAFFLENLSSILKFMAEKQQSIKNKTLSGNDKKLVNLFKNCLTENIGDLSFYYDIQSECQKGSGKFSHALNLFSLLAPAFTVRLANLDKKGFFTQMVKKFLFLKKGEYHPQKESSIDPKNFNFLSQHKRIKLYQQLINLRIDKSLEESAQKAITGQVNLVLKGAHRLNKVWMKAALIHYFRDPDFDSALGKRIGLYISLPENQAVILKALRNYLTPQDYLQWALKDTSGTVAQRLIKGDFRQWGVTWLFGFIPWPVCHQPESSLAYPQNFLSFVDKFHQNKKIMDRIFNFESVGPFRYILKWLGLASDYAFVLRGDQWLSLVQKKLSKGENTLYNRILNNEKIKQAIQQQLLTLSENTDTVELENTMDRGWLNQALPYLALSEGNLKSFFPEAQKDEYVQKVQRVQAKVFTLYESNKSLWSQAVFKSFEKEPADEVSIVKEKIARVAIKNKAFAECDGEDMFFDFLFSEEINKAIQYYCKTNNGVQKYPAKILAAMILKSKENKNHSPALFEAMTTFLTDLVSKPQEEFQTWLNKILSEKQGTQIFEQFFSFYLEQEKNTKAPLKNALSFYTQLLTLLSSNTLQQDEGLSTRLKFAVEICKEKLAHCLENSSQSTDPGKALSPAELCTSDAFIQALIAEIPDYLNLSHKWDQAKVPCLIYFVQHKNELSNGELTSIKQKFEASNSSFIKEIKKLKEALLTGVHDSPRSSKESSQKNPGDQKLVQELNEVLFGDACVLSKKKKQMNSSPSVLLSTYQSNWLKNFSAEQASQNEEEQAQLKLVDATV